MHRTTFRLARGLAIAALALGMGGCLGPRQFDVTGQVKYNGAPLALPGGMIVFVGPTEARWRPRSNWMAPTTRSK